MGGGGGGRGNYDVMTTIIIDLQNEITRHKIREVRKRNHVLIIFSSLSGPQADVVKLSRVIVNRLPSLLIFDVYLPS